MVDWQQAITRPDIDAVIIATPPDLHSRIAVAALEAGKHVLCEKPLARTASEAQVMLAAARAADTVSMAGFSIRQTPALLQAKRLLDEGALGEVVHVTGRYFQDFGRDASRPITWRFEAARAGSGALADIGSHLADCVRWLVGEVAAVSAVSRTVVTERQSAPVDVAAFLARFDSGALGVFEVSRLATGRKNQLRIEVNGTRGSLAFDWERNNELEFVTSEDATDRHGFRTVLAGPKQPGFAGLVPVPGLGVGFLDAFIVQAANFACAIAGLPPIGAPASFEDGLRACEIVDAVIESARNGQWTTTTTTTTTPPHPSPLPRGGEGAQVNRAPSPQPSLRGGEGAQVNRLAPRGERCTRAAGTGPPQAGEGWSSSCSSLASSPWWGVPRWPRCRRSPRERVPSARKCSRSPSAPIRCPSSRARRAPSSSTRDWPRPW
jgi:predicted dehydrogenase